MTRTSYHASDPARALPSGPWNTLEAAAILADYTGPLYNGMKLPPDMARCWQTIKTYCRLAGARDWRTAQISSADLRLIADWLGLTDNWVWLDDPQPPVAPDNARQGESAKPPTEAQMHRQECQTIGKRLWAEHPDATQADLMKHPDLRFYAQAYQGKNTVAHWLSEVDPRPKEQRRGRPKKIPVARK